MSAAAILTPDSWSPIMARAYELFDDLEDKGFGDPGFCLGGGTVLMFRFKHRLSKDIDFFGYDAQWLSLLSPRLNDAAAALATSYNEQANTVKIVMPEGDIDFIIAGDVTIPLIREKMSLAGRMIPVEATSEILAKKLFYRAASFKARDVYDLSAAIDLDPTSACNAVRAAAPSQAALLRRLGELSQIDEDRLFESIIPYDGRLPHAANMIAKVTQFVTAGLARSPAPRDKTGGNG